MKTKIDPEKIKPMLKELITAERNIIKATASKKAEEERTKEELAMAKQYYKKDGKTLDTAKVKLPLFKKAAKIALENEENKLQTELEIQEEYITDILNDDGIKNYAVSLATIEANLKETKDDLKEILKAYLETEDSSIIQALLLIAKQEAKQQENVDEKPSTDHEILELIQLIKKEISKE